MILMSNTFYKLYFRDLKEDFEFSNEKYFTDTEKYAENYIYKREILIDEILFFVKMDNDIYYDLIGRNVFKRVDNNVFYNDRTGLYFDENMLIKTNDSKEVLNKILDFDYSYYIKDYFHIHRYLNMIDNRYIKKSIGYMLVKKIKFNRERKNDNE